MLKHWIATVIVGSALLGAPASARADGKNEIRAVSFDDDAGTTRIHVRGAETPTFTVYKLERPSRVVIDLPQARLADVLRGHESAAMIATNTWAVSTIAAQQLDDGGQVVRVIVTLARPGRYDVKTDGNEVVVMVTARDAAPKTASPEDLARAQAESAQAKKDVAAAQTDVAQAKEAASAAQLEAERLRAKADAAQHAADDARKTSLQNSAATAAEIENAKQVAAAAQAEATRAKAEAAHAKELAMAAQTDAKTAAARAKAEADQMKLDAAKELASATREAEAAKQDAAKEKAAAQDAAAKARADATLAKQDAAKEKAAAQDAAAKARADAALAQEDAAKERMTAAKEKAAAQDAAAKARADAALAQQDAARVRAEAEAAKQDAARIRAEAVADKQKAETARGDAEKLMRDAKSELATLDKKTAAAQQLEDKARATHAAALAREEAARDAAERAAAERLAAEDAAKRAAEARDKSSSQAKSERDKLAAEAHAAELRLAAAQKATEEAEGRRAAAETAQAQARAQLETSKTALATVEQQRTTTENAAAAASRKRSEAEAAAQDAARRRSDAEVAASEAMKKRSAAETAAAQASKQRGEAEAQREFADQQRKSAEDAARQARIATTAAEQQRVVAETAARAANDSKTKAEGSLATLNAKRDAAEQAAQDVEARSKAEAKAQAELAAATARKAGDAELAKARTETARLASQRRIAEAELADRRKDVAAQQAEADRLKVAAVAAHDAAQREETRRTQLASQRAAEEQELARIQSQKAAIVAVKPVVVQPVVVQPKSVAAKLGPNAKISDITFRGADLGGDVTIALAGDANVELGEVTPTRIELIVDHAELGAKLERKLDVSKFGSPIRTIASFRDRHTPDRVRLVAELAQPMTPTLDRDAKAIRWHFAGQVAKHVAPPPQAVGGFGAASTPVAQQAVSQVPPSGRRHTYHGQTISIDIKDAPIHDLLRLIAETGHVNIVVPDSITAQVTVKLNGVPWDQALEVVLQSHALWYRREGNLYRIATRKEIDTEDKEEAERRAAAIAAESPRPEVLPLNYASATELKQRLESMLSPKGHIEVEDRTNALIINDVSGNREQIVRLATSLDTQTPQISIEARIVEARSTFTREFGIQWGGKALAGASTGNATGLAFPSSLGLVGANTDASTISTGVASPSDFAVNLPAATGSGEGGALGLSLGSVSGNFNINLRLSALEDSGTIRIISAPKVTVLNNKEAKISQGTSIPISVVSAAGAQTQFVQADLALTVKPYVSQRDCAIAMDLNVTKNEPDFVNVGARGDPSILTKTAKTSMLVLDGETSVLGGIYTRNTGLSYKQIPFLGDLPVIGWLFKHRQENDDRTEILIFITPKITNKALLHCQ